MRNIIIVLILIATNLVGQDAQFSQYYNSPLTLNPALTGSMLYSFRISANHRSQWTNLGAAYLTSSVAADIKLDGNEKSTNSSDGKTSSRRDALGLGILFISDKSGEGLLTFNTLLASIAYHKTLNRSGSQFISLGLQAGGFNASVNRDGLRFASQFDEVDFNTDLPTGENMLGSTRLIFDWNAGFSYHNEINEIIMFTSGLSMYHLGRPNQSLMNREDLLAPRITLYAGVDIKINEKTYLSPSLFAMKQNRATYVMPGVDVEYLICSEKVITVGTWYRLNDAIHNSIGLRTGAWNVTISYDLTISTLSRFNNMNGGFELGISFNEDIFSKSRPSRRGPRCFDFLKYK